MNIWANPHQRFGFIIVNVLVGPGVETEDRELFFGPIHPNDIFIEIPFERTHIRLEQLMAQIGLFDSAKESARRGYGGVIPEGFTDITGIGKAKHRVSILKIS